MDYINSHSIKVIEKLLFSPLLSFTELHGIMYITGHYTFRPPGTECKQLLHCMGNKAPKIRICLWNFLGVGVEWGMRRCRLSGQESKPDKSVYQTYHSTVSAVSLFL